MKIVAPPVLLVLATIVCGLSLTPRFTQGQTPQKPKLSASSQQKIEEQKKVILHSVDEHTVSYLRTDHGPPTPFQKPDMPFRGKVLALYKQVYEEAAAQVLGELVQSPLSKDDLKLVTERLQLFAVSDFAQFDVPYGAPASAPQEIEARCKRIIESWDTEGHSINKEHVLWKLRFELSTFFQPLPDEEQRAQITNQLTKTGALVEKDLFRLVPQLDQKEWGERTTREIAMYSSNLKDPFYVRLRLLSPEQIQIDLAQSRVEAAHLAEVLSKNPRWNSSVIGRYATGDQIFQLLWKGVMQDMALLPTSPLLAKYPKDEVLRYLDYHTKIVVAPETGQR